MLNREDVKIEISRLLDGTSSHKYTHIPTGVWIVEDRPREESAHEFMQKMMQKLEEEVELFNSNK
jgi:hypothetical protein